MKILFVYFAKTIIIIIMST